MIASTSYPVLRVALLANAGFSTLCGLTLLLAGGALEPVLGAPALALRVVGLLLLPFALGLGLNACRATPRRSEAWLAVALDLVWVLGSVLLILGELWPLTVAGRWSVIGVAEVVALFALLQTLGLRRTRAAA